MFKNWSKHEVFPSTTILLKSSFANHKLLTDFVNDCCEMWREPKDSSQENWAVSSYCPKIGCLRMSKEGDLASLSLLRW